MLLVWAETSCPYEVTSWPITALQALLSLAGCASGARMSLKPPSETGRRPWSAVTAQGSPGDASEAAAVPGGRRLSGFGLRNGR
jgi:hypothetical protein